MDLVPVPRPQRSVVLGTLEVFHNKEAHQVTAATLFLLLSAPTYYGVPGVAMSYEPLVSYWCNQYLVPRNLGYKIMVHESDGDPAAVGSEWVWVAEKTKSGNKKKSRGHWVRGKTLARGLFMISVKDETEHLKNAGLGPLTFDPWNPSDSCRVGIAYLKSLLVYFDGEFRPTISGFNAGRRAASRWWYDGGSLPYETRSYLKGVLR